MNKTVTTEQDILRVSRRMVLEEGILAFSMRSVAKACGVAVGSLYNYFPSKSRLLGATIESIWREIFLPFGQHEEWGERAEEEVGGGERPSFNSDIVSGSQKCWQVNAGSTWKGPCTQHHGRGRETVFPRSPRVSKSV